VSEGCGFVPGPDSSREVLCVFLASQAIPENGLAYVDSLELNSSGGPARCIILIRISPPHAAW
jgi:hypothetical protein